MKSIIIILLSGLLTSGCVDNKKSNELQSNETKAEYVADLDKGPMPVGGMEAIQSKVVYPPEAKEKNIQGKVLVKLLVDEKGNLEGTEIVQSAGKLLDMAAIDAVGKVKFTPGYKDGKAVKSGVIIPILFKLDGDGKKGKASLKKEGEYYLEAQQMPLIVGGIQAILKNIVYPEAEKKAGREGKVIVAVYVDEKGAIVKKEVVKGVNSALDQASLNALEGIQFTPARVDGKNVKSKIMLPIQFRLK